MSSFDVSLCPQEHPGRPASWCRMSPATHWPQLWAMWGRSHLKPHGGQLEHDVQGSLWFFSSLIGAWDPWDSGLRPVKLEPSRMHTAACPLPCVHLSRCHLLPRGKPVLGLGPHSGYGGLLRGICPSSLRSIGSRGLKGGETVVGM